MALSVPLWPQQCRGHCSSHSEGTAPTGKTSDPDTGILLPGAVGMLTTLGL